MWVEKKVATVVALAFGSRSEFRAGSLFILTLRVPDFF